MERVCRWIHNVVVGMGVFMLVAGATHASAAQEQSGRRPNVLLYVVDDQGMDDAGCYGNPVIRTPGLDTLASEGTRFTHAFCTTASCSPSRSVILTGLHTHTNGQYGLAHASHHFSSHANLKTLPVLLTEAGYRTASVGKFHVEPEATYHFSQYILAPGGKRGSPADMAERCRDLIAAKADSPFFLYFCTTEPHRPFHREGSQPVDPKDVIVPTYLPDWPETREELAQYYGSVERADAGLRRLIEILKETGQWDTTLVIFVSDNGIAFPGAKTTLYEPGMRLPCVVRTPGQQHKGRVCNAMVTWADLTPTILDFAGAGKDLKCFGRSFRSVIEQENPEGWDEIYASHTFHEVTMYYPMRVVRGRRYKLIWNIAHELPYPFASDLYQSTTWQAALERKATHFGKRSVDAFIHRPEFELYDLQADPDEVHNLADDPGHAKTLSELKAKLKDFQENTKDPWLLKWDRE